MVDKFSMVLRQVIGLKSCGIGLSFMGNITVLPPANHVESDFELSLIRIVSRFLAHDNDFPAF